MVKLGSNSKVTDGSMVSFSQGKTIIQKQANPERDPGAAGSFLVTQVKQKVNSPYLSSMI